MLVRSLFNEHDQGPTHRHMICIGKPKLRSERRLDLLFNQRAARKSKMTGQIPTDQGSQKTPLLSIKSNAFDNFSLRNHCTMKCTRLPLVFNSRENAHVLEYNTRKVGKIFSPPFSSTKSHGPLLPLGKEDWTSSTLCSCFSGLTLNLTYLILQQNNYKAQILRQVDT